MVELLECLIALSSTFNRARFKGDAPRSCFVYRVDELGKVEDNEAAKFGAETLPSYDDPKRLIIGMSFVERASRNKERGLPVDVSSKVFGEPALNGYLARSARTSIAFRPLRE
jgi:hypothetical protein